MAMANIKKYIINLDSFELKKILHNKLRNFPKLI